MKGVVWNNVYFLGAVAALSGLLFGFDASIAASVGTAVNIHFNLLDSPAMQGFWVAAVPLGAFFGAMSGGSVAGILGRRRGLIADAVLFLVGILAACTAPNFAFFVFSRLIMGAAIGNSAVITPMYMAEVAPAGSRGRILFFYQLSIVTGILLSFLVGVAVDALISDTDLNWRIMIACGTVPAVFFVLGMVKMPESPRRLMEKGRSTQAREILRSLMGSQEAETVAVEIQTALKSRLPVDVKTMLGRTILPVILLGFFLQFFQQTTGINADMYFGPEIFREGGFGPRAGMWAQVAMGLVNLLATIGSIFFVDRLGRRKLMFVGVSGIIVTLVLQSFLFARFSETLPADISSPQSVQTVHRHVAPNTHVLVHPTADADQEVGLSSPNSLTYMIMASILLYIVFFAISAGPLCWLMISEIFPIRFRGIGMSIAVAANWLMDYFVSQLFPMMKDGLGMDMTCLVYAGCTFVGLVLACRFLPETKGVALEHIESNVYARKPLRRIGAS